MSINAEVTKLGSENALSTIRKFSRRVQGTGLVKAVRNRRYFKRSASKTVTKKRALKLLKRRADYRQKIKEGKIAEAPMRGNPRRSMSNATENQTPRGGSGLGEGTPIAR